jgi:hypothetical protein
VVRNVIPHRCVGLAVGDLAERAAIDPGHDPPVDDEVPGRDLAGVLGALQRLTPDLDPARGGIDGQDRGL